MTIKRGKRGSLVLETERWRFRLVIGRFRNWWKVEHERHAYGMGGRTGLVTSRFFLLTFRQSGYPKSRSGASPEGTTP